MWFATWGNLSLIQVCRVCLLLPSPSLVEFEAKNLAFELTLCCGVLESEFIVHFLRGKR